VEPARQIGCGANDTTIGITSFENVLSDQSYWFHIHSQLVLSGPPRRLYY
jgi:hypothetical protein